MGNYRVITGQNIYDVALHLYGSIEGIVDLLINNPGLSLETELRTGQELTYIPPGSEQHVQSDKGKDDGCW